MTKLRSKSDGFSAVETLLVLIIVAIVGFVGWYVYNAHKKTTDNLNSASQISAKAAAEAKTKSPIHTLTDAQGLVQRTYGSVLTYQNKNKGVSQAEVDTVKANVTPALYATLSAAVQSPASDPILCSQSIPTKAVAQAGKVSNGMATITVKETFGTTVTQVTTMVDLASLKIDSITCPV